MSLRKFASRYVGINALLRMLGTACALALVLPMFPASALAQGCHFDPGNPVCIPDSDPGSVGPTVTETIYWAAIALSPSTLQSGSSHGQTSEAEAKQRALKNCATLASDCKVVNWHSHLCFALAVNGVTHTYGYDSARSRSEAATKALARCNVGSSKGCVVQASPCAGDDIRWSSPLPLPPPSSVQTSKIDPRTIGTWVLSINPGRWVWEIAPNGAYEFHSEAVDGAPSHAGTLTANDGHWTMHALNIEYADSGTYTFNASGTLVATGKLGTGSWHRLTK
jgi:hypothetical protein